MSSSIDEPVIDPRRAFCDLVVERAAHVMQNEGHAPVPMIIDRLITYSVAQACASDGSAATAAMLRAVAAKVEGGLFHSITGEGSRQ